MEWLRLVRWAHIAAATIWLGEVATIIFVIVPAVRRIEGEAKARFLSEVFPRIFRMASVVAAVAVLTGATLLISRFHGSWDTLLESRTPALLVGATLGTLLAAFHFIVEPRLSRLIEQARETGDTELVSKVVGVLRIVPVAGFGILSMTLLLMMFGSGRF